MDHADAAGPQRQPPRGTGQIPTPFIAGHPVRQAFRPGLIGHVTTPSRPPRGRARPPPPSRRGAFMQLHNSSASALIAQFARIKKYG
jgi:hypothetical protein